MRKKYNISSLEGHDKTTIFDFLFMSVSHLLMAIMVSNYFKDNLFAVFLIAWIIGGFWSSAAGLAIHEASHGLVIPGKYGCYISGLIAECPLFLPAYLSFRHYHMPHHSYISIDLGDKNGAISDENKKLPKYDPDLPSKFEAFLFSYNMFTRILFLTV